MKPPHVLTFIELQTTEVRYFITAKAEHTARRLLFLLLLFLCKVVDL